MIEIEARDSVVSSVCDGSGVIGGSGRGANGNLVARASPPPSLEVRERARASELVAVAVAVVVADEGASERERRKELRLVCAACNSLDECARCTQLVQSRALSANVCIECAAHIAASCSLARSVGLLAKSGSSMLNALSTNTNTVTDATTKPAARTIRFRPLEALLSFVCVWCVLVHDLWAVEGEIGARTQHFGPHFVRSLAS